MLLGNALSVVLHVGEIPGDGGASWHWQSSLTQHSPSVAVRAVMARASDTNVPRPLRLGSSDGPSEPAKPPTSCGDHDAKHACLDIGAEEGPCAWCVGDFMPASCVGVKAAEWIPGTVATCKMPRHHKGEGAKLAKGKGKHDKPEPPPASCGDNKDKHACLKVGASEGECAWCKGTYMPGSCISSMAAKYLPTMVAECKMPKKKKQQEAAAAAAANNDDDDDADDSNKSGGGMPWGPGGGGWWPSGGGKSGGQGGGCMSHKSRKACLHGSDMSGGACAWCHNPLMASGSCLDESTSKFLPPMVADCEAGKPRKHHTTVVVS